MAYIYKITNLVNGKSYIGQTIKKLEERWQQHISILEAGQGSSKLQYAFDKYGKDNFAFQRLEECQVEELDEREKYWINEYDTYENGYNSTLGGQQGNYKYDYRIIADKYLELRSLRKTAELIGCSVSTVQSAIRSFDINAKEICINGNRTGPDTSNYDLYYEEYLKNPHTTEVAKKFGTSPLRVSRAIKELSGKTPRELYAERKSLEMSGQKRGKYNTKKSESEKVEK